MKYSYGDCLYSYYILNYIQKNDTFGCASQMFIIYKLSVQFFFLATITKYNETLFVLYIDCIRGYYSVMKIIR